MPSEHHPSLSPSRFPMFDKCPCYSSGEPGEAAIAGSRQHQLLAAMLNPNLAIPEDRFGCSNEEDQQVLWAHDHISVCTTETRQIEKRLSLLDPDFNEVSFGTLDVVDIVKRAAGDILVVMDYKSGEDHGYLPQMAVYARMAMDAYGHKRAEVQEVYGRHRFVKKYVLNYEDTDFIFDIIARVNNPDKRPSICDFCNWCVKSGTCQEATGPVVKVATEYEPDHPVASLPLAEVKTWHASEITDPNQMAIVYRVAEHVGKWADAVKAHARNAALNGMRIPGYELVNGKKTKTFNNIEAAYERSGLSSEDFMACCTVSVTQVEKAMAKASGLKGKAAKTAFEEAMGDTVLVKENAPTLKSVSV